MLSKAIPEAAQAEESQARLAATLRATGFAAGFGTEQLAEMASAMQLTGIHGDEEIKQAMALLSTFRSVSGNAFKKATELSQDLAATGFGDLNSAA
jgi:hypothetical protein